MKTQNTRWKYVPHFSDLKRTDQRKTSVLPLMSSKGLSALFLFLMASLTACDSKVKLAGDSREQVEKGVDAQNRLKEIDRIAVQHSDLEADLQEMVNVSEVSMGREGGISVSLLGYDENREGFRTPSKDCLAAISVRGRLDSEELLSFFEGSMKAFGDSVSCPTLLISSERFEVKKDSELATDGRNLIIIADFVVLNGKIITTPAHGSRAESGKKGGDLKIYALGFKRGPHSEIITSGSNAGEMILPKKALSKEQIKAIRVEAEKNIRYVDAAGNGWKYTAKQKIKMAPNLVRAQDHPGIEDVYSKIQSKAREFIKKRHPSFRGDAPDPFAGGVARPKGVDYFWMLEKQEGTQLLDGNSFVVNVPWADVRQGGAPGRIEIHVADPLTELMNLNIVSSIGDVPIDSKDSRKMVEATAVNAPITVKLQKKITYRFALMHKNSGAEYDTAKRVQTWSGEVSQKPINQKLNARVNIVSPQTASDSLMVQPEPVFPVLRGASTDIYALAHQALLGGEEVYLGQGIRDFKDWAQDWEKLMARAKAVKYKVERPSRDD